MRSMILTGHDQPLQLQDIAVPVPAADEVLIEVHACALNFADTLLIKGTYQEKPSLPFAPGLEVSGLIHAVGADVTGFQPGQRVVSFCPSGGLSEFVSVAANRCLSIPDDMPFHEAAALPVAYGTSHVALDHRARLKPGERLLVLGASGGVGLTAVEIGKLMGAEVVACARGAAKLEIARRAGADHLLNSETDDIREAVLSLGGADVVYDPVGGDQFKAALRATNPDGRILPIGFASGDIPQIPANIIMVKNITVIGCHWSAYAQFNPQVLTDSFARIFDWFKAGKIKPHVSNILPLEQANAGLPDFIGFRR